MGKLRVLSSLFVLFVIISLLVNKAEGSEEEEEAKDGAKEEEGLNQFRRGRILNSGNICDLCSYYFFFYLISSSSVTPPHH